MLKLALRMTWRDLRAGELHFLLVALMLAVASLSAVQFFTGRMDAALERDANQLLGGDLRVSAEAPIDRAWRREAEILGLLTADTVELQSMASAVTGASIMPRMVLLKAVGPGYPLRGRLTLHQGQGSVPAPGIPTAGTAWVDRSLLASLDLQLGQHIELGGLRLAVTRTIDAEPDRGPAGLSFAPRVLIALDDLPATGLVQPGALASWDLLIAGDKKALATFAAWGKVRLKQGERIDTLATRSATTSDALNRASTFLALVGLLAAMLASLAVAMAARRFMLRHADACAILRCLGLEHRRVMAMFVGEFLLVGLLGSAAGVAIGYGAHFVLVEWLGTLLTAEIPAASWAPAWHGLLIGMLLLAGFGMPPLLQLRDIPHSRLLRGERIAPAPRTLVFSALGLMLFAALMLWQSSDLTVGALTVGAFAAATLLFAAVARAAIGMLRFVPASVDRGVMRLALAGMRRRPAAMVTEVVALALGLMALLLMTVVRGDLLAAWQDTAPADAPNHIIFGVQAHQKDDVAARLQPLGAALYPVMRARLKAINGKPARADDYTERVAKNAVERELDISSESTLPPANTLVAGSWFAPGSTLPEVSVSEISAKALGLKLGDRMTFEFSGTPLEVQVTSLRKVDWRTRRANFGYLLNPAAARGLAASWVGAVHVPPSDSALVGSLVRDHPNLTVMNTGAMLTQLQGMLDQVSKAVEFLFLFTLAAGLLVLYATLASTQDERQHQAAVLRALGASRAQLSRAQRIEFALSGALAGLLAAAGATAASWALARFALNLEWHFSPLLWIAGLLAGSTCALIGSWAGLRAVLATSPLHTLRTH